MHEDEQSYNMDLQERCYPTLVITDQTPYHWNTITTSELRTYYEKSIDLQKKTTFDAFYRKIRELKNEDIFQALNNNHPPPTMEGAFTSWRTNLKKMDAVDTLSTLCVPDIVLQDHMVDISILFEQNADVLVQFINEVMLQSITSQRIKPHIENAKMLIKQIQIVVENMMHVNDPYSIHTHVQICMNTIRDLIHGHCHVVGIFFGAAWRFFGDLLWMSHLDFMSIAQSMARSITSSIYSAGQSLVMPLIDADHYNSSIYATISKYTFTFISQSLSYISSSLQLLIPNHLSIEYGFVLSTQLGATILEQKIMFYTGTSHQEAINGMTKIATAGAYLGNIFVNSHPSLMETFIRDVHELKKRKKATNEEIHPMEIAELFCDAYHKDNRGRQPNVWYSMLFKGIETVLKTYRNTKTQRDNLPLKIKMVTNSINRLFFHEPSTDGRLSIYSKDASTTATLDYLQTIASTVDATDVIQNVPSVQRARVSWMHIGDSSLLDFVQENVSKKDDDFSPNSTWRSVASRSPSVPSQEGGKQRKYRKTGITPRKTPNKKTQKTKRHSLSDSYFKKLNNF